MTKRVEVCNSLKLFKSQWTLFGEVLLLDFICKQDVRHRPSSLFELGF